MEAHYSRTTTGTDDAEELSTAELPNKVTEKSPISSTEQQERSKPISVTNLPVRTQILSTPANNDVTNVR